MASAWPRSAVGGLSLRSLGRADPAAPLPGIGDFVWFDKVEEGTEWSIETSEGAIEAFAAGIGAPTFAGERR